MERLRDVTLWQTRETPTFFYRLWKLFSFLQLTSILVHIFGKFLAFCAHHLCQVERYTVILWAHYATESQAIIQQ